MTNAAKNAYENNGTYMPKGRVKGAEEVLAYLRKHNNVISHAKVVEFSTYGAKGKEYSTKTMWYLKKYGAKFETTKEGRNIVKHKMTKAPDFELPAFRANKSELIKSKSKSRNRSRNRASKSDQEQVAA